MGDRKARIAELRERLEATTTGFLNEVEAMNEEQRHCRPASGGWTALEVTEHLTLAEESILEAVKRRRDDPERHRRSRRRLRDRFFRGVMNVVLGLGIKVKAPSKKMEPDREVPPKPFDELRDAWLGYRSEIESRIDQIPPDQLGHDLFRHPVAGPLDVAQGIQFLIDHITHHRRQLGRIQADAGFPVATPTRSSPAASR